MQAALLMGTVAVSEELDNNNSNSSSYIINSAMMATAHRPPKNKFGTSSDGTGLRSSFLMCPPDVPSKKAKLFHAHDQYAITKNDSSDDNHVGNDTNDRAAVCSPTDVLTHPSAIYPSTSTSLQNNTCIQPQEVVVFNTLPPSLRGTTEAVKALNSSSCNNSKSTAYRRKSDDYLMASSTIHQQQQLVAFPTEALYVLTCCVKTVSKKKLLRANNSSAAAGSNRVCDDAVDPIMSSATTAESSSSIGRQFVREHPDCGRSQPDDGKVSYGSYGDLHPFNPSLDCLIARQTLGNDQGVEQSSRVMATPSVFVMDNKHAQHFCHFSQPKMFAIRPKESSDLMQSSASSFFSTHNDVDGEGGSSRVGAGLDHPLKHDEHNSSCTDNTTYSPFSPIISSPTHSSSMSTKMPTPIPPSPTKGSSMVDTTGLLSNMCYPQTPNVKSTAENTPSSVESYAISPIENNVEGMSHNIMSPSLPLSSHTTPINSHIGSPTHGTSKIRAVSFSESYEAFSRLANRFWPGPVIIYAPARRINVGNNNRKDSMPLIQPHSSQKTPRSSSTSSNEMSSSSLTSLPSFTNLPALDSGEGGVPVLPPSVLIPGRDLLPHDQECDHTNEEHFFVGMQCPSHPLARKILTEIHRPRGSSSSSSTLPIKHSVSTDSFASMLSMDMSTTSQYCQGKQQKHIRRGIAVVGSYIEPLLVDNTTILANTAENATTILSTSSSSNNDDSNQSTQQIYVVNGEDTTREKFSIPTCNYGRKPSISLLVDGDSRTIYLLHRHDDGDGNDYNYVKERVYRALLQAPSLLKSATTNNMDSCSNKVSSTKEIDRVITAVLSRWKVEERAV